MDSSPAVSDSDVDLHWAVPNVRHSQLTMPQVGAVNRLWQFAPFVLAAAFFCSHQSHVTRIRSQYPLQFNPIAGGVEPRFHLVARVTIPGVYPHLKITVDDVTRNGVHLCGGILSGGTEIKLPFTLSESPFEPTFGGTITKKVGLEPIELAAKEGLALINGVQISNAIGLCAMARMRNLSKVADIVGALSVEALMGSHAPFAARVTRVRPHPGARACGSNLRDLLRDSEVEKSHADCERVQDPYSFRCIPQVHGSAKDALAWAESVLMIEADSATDNPLVFPGSGTVSAGNFHGHPIAMAMD
ncbi:MAG TPA: hypothetical protein EYN66_07980, partial [Myxococcales bacterium]|nr:hypothetical protein [Myxococcales bacterium]